MSEMLRIRTPEMRHMWTESWGGWFALCGFARCNTRTAINIHRYHRGRGRNEIQRAMYHTIFLLHAGVCVNVNM
jgi:hypothetical protein